VHIESPTDGNGLPAVAHIQSGTWNPWRATRAPQLQAGAEESSPPPRSPRSRRESVTEKAHERKRRDVEGDPTPKLLAVRARSRQMPRVTSECDEVLLMQMRVVVCEVFKVEYERLLDKDMTTYLRHFHKEHAAVSEPRQDTQAAPVRSLTRPQVMVSVSDLPDVELVSQLSARKSPASAADLTPLVKAAAAERAGSGRKASHEVSESKLPHVLRFGRRDSALLDAQATEAVAERCFERTHSRIWPFVIDLMKFEHTHLPPLALDLLVSHMSYPLRLAQHLERVLLIDANSSARSSELQRHANELSLIRARPSDDEYIDVAFKLGHMAHMLFEGVPCHHLPCDTNRVVGSSSSDYFYLRLFAIGSTTAGSHDVRLDRRVLLDDTDQCLLYFEGGDTARVAKPIRGSELQLTTPARGTHRAVWMYEVRTAVSACANKQRLLLSLNAQHHALRWLLPKAGDAAPKPVMVRGRDRSPHIQAAAMRLLIGLCVQHRAGQAAIAPYLGQLMHLIETDIIDERTSESRRAARQAVMMGATWVDLGRMGMFVWRPKLLTSVCC
jgi:hypothetical protein